ncbi:MAG: transcriptional repressor [Bacteroidota bacterium]
MKTKGKTEILKEHQLRHTGSREDILAIFMREAFALSHADVEHRLPEGFDRVTLYRTLKTFVDKGLIHKVLDDSGEAKYALCKEPCSTDHHHHGHVHFKCTRCGLTNCLEEVQIPSVQLPKGYKTEDVNLLVQGICLVCNKKTASIEEPV